MVVLRHVGVFQWLFFLSESRCHHRGVCVVSASGRWSGPIRKFKCLSGLQGREKEGGELANVGKRGHVNSLG